MKKLVLLAAITGLAALAVQPNQDAEVKRVPAHQTRIESGTQMFHEYCASCHGAGGTGDGPAAAALKVAPSDLTTLKARNGGKFPVGGVKQTLRNGDNILAHGSSDMPLWGSIFRSLDGNSSAVMELRITNLTHYLESIQK